MLKRISSSLKNNIGVLFLTVVVLVIATANVSKGTFLTGWDTLHPEFNYKTYWSRMIFSAWQEHQGLGAVATQAHASEIPRVVTLMLFDVFLPTRGVRYAYAFLMLLFGPLGIYFFLKHALLKFKKLNIDKYIVEAAAVTGGLFYLLNLVTVQHFYIPLEMFLTHYGYLGFFMLGVVKLLEEVNKKNLLYFFVISFLMAPQAHTSTLFFALLINLAAFLCIYWLVSKSKLVIFKRSLLIFFLLFLVNAFWLFPNIYFIVKHASTVQFSKIHSLFNDEAVLQNQAYGTLKNIALGKGYLFNWGEHIGNLKYGPLLDEWIFYHRSSNLTTIGYALFYTSLFGFFVSLFKKNKNFIATSAFMLVSMFFLINVNEPTGFIYKFFEENIPLFKEAFRFHFTKFSITLVFSYAVFFGLAIYTLLEGMSLLFNKLSKSVKSQRPALSALFIAIPFIVLSYWMKPIYEGSLISSSMRVGIPEPYFQMFNYLNKQDDYGRVANLPIQSFWGWVYHDWDTQSQLGYQGAGFLWFGIKQPLMDREFDRWNTINQQYYNDMVKAVYAEDLVALKEVLDRYKIKWVLHDTSVISPGHDQNILFEEQTIKFLGSAPYLKLINRYGTDLYLYENATTYSRSEGISGADEPYQEEQYLFRKVTDYSEEIDPAFITSTQNYVAVGKKGQAGNLQSTEKVVLPFELYAQVIDDQLSLSVNDLLSDETISSQYIFEVPLLGLGEFVALSVNNDIYELKISELDEERLLGTSFLPLDSEFIIKAIAPSEEITAINTNDLLPVLENCSNAGDSSSYTVKRLENGFQLEAVNIDACLTTALGTFLEQPNSENKSYLRLQVDGDFQEHPCVYDEEQKVCSNFITDKNVSYTLLKDNLDTQYLRFYSRGLTRGSNTSNFENIQVRIFDKELYSMNTKLSPDVLNRIKETTYEMPLVFAIEELYGGKVSDLASNPRYCDTGEPINIYNEETETVMYATSDRQLCDTVSFRNTPHNVGYLLNVRSKNVEGTPLRICLTNEYSKRCDKYIEMPNNPEFVDSYYFVPAFDDKSGYTVNISNISFAEQQTTNELSHIRLIPIPYEFLMNLVDVNSSLDGDVYVYYEAYEDGWIAFCGLKPCPAKHIMYDGWANAWLFEEPYDGEIKVYFWPQILQHIGFILLFGTFFVIIRSSHKVNSNKP